MSEFNNLINTFSEKTEGKPKKDKLLEYEKALKAAAKELTKQKFTIKSNDIDFSFTINRLDAETAHDLLEVLKEDIGSQEGHLSIAVLFKVSRGCMKNDIKPTIYPTITVDDGKIAQPFDIAIKEYQPVQYGLEAAHIYELIVRALFINFTRSASYLLKSLNKILG